MREHAQHELAQTARLHSTITTLKQVLDKEPFLVPPNHSCHNSVSLHRFQGAFKAHVDTPVRPSKSDLTSKPELDQVSVCMTQMQLTS